MCHKSTTWDPQLYFPSEGSNTQDFYTLKNPLTLEGFGEYDNHGTTGVNSKMLSHYSE